MFRPLLSANDLAALLRARDLDPGRPLVIADCRFALSDPGQGIREYAAGHLPGAVYVHLDEDLSSPVVPGVTGRHPLPSPSALSATLGRLGISPDTTVVAYDGGPGAFAARLWWLLRWVGHEAVSVLDGGFAAWTAAGFATDTIVAPAIPAAARYPVRPADTWVVDAVTVLEATRSASAIVLDARERVRWLGDEEPIDPVAGRIPGAVSAPWVENVHDGRFREPADLRARYLDALGGHPPADAIVYCGSGVTAAHDVLAMAIAGLDGARLYAGSWSEWITEPSRPVERG